MFNVIAKAYSDDAPITITADEGEFDRATSIMHLTKNVIATTDDGARLLTEVMDIQTETSVIETEELAEVRKDSMRLIGLGAKCEQGLNHVTFFKDIQVFFNENEEDQIEITCDGPLEIDYEKNHAIFKNNVISRDRTGVLYSDDMDVYYDKESREAEKIYAYGDVLIEQGKKKTYSDSVLYLVKEGRVILDGDPEGYGEPGER